jgi:hypothetical protein
LTQDVSHQKHALRFIENHDEPRAAAAFLSEQARAAAVILATVEGAHLYHQGQLEGRRVRVPVHLARGKQEPSDAKLRKFYDTLLQMERNLHQDGGEWHQLRCRSRWGMASPQVLAWSWRTAKGETLTVVNYSPRPARTRLPAIKQAADARVLFASDDAALDHISLVGGRAVSLAPWQFAIIKLEYK